MGSGGAVACSLWPENIPRLPRLVQWDQALVPSHTDLGAVFLGKSPGLSRLGTKRRYLEDVCSFDRFYMGLPRARTCVLGWAASWLPGCSLSG